MTEPDHTFDPRGAAFRTLGQGASFPEPHTERWPLAARASLVMSLCGLFWGVLGAAVLQIASR